MKQTKDENSSASVELHKKSETKCPDGFIIREVEGMGVGVFAQRDLPAGMLISPCSGYKVNLEHVTPMCLQLDEDVFLQGTGQFDDYINHSCEPNCVVRFKNGVPTLVVLNGIKVGEQLTFDYNTTEWDMLEQEAKCNEEVSFSCMCGSSRCVGPVKGFRYLNADQRDLRKDYLSPFVSSKFSTF